MTGPAVVFTNDWMTYGVNVTNLGPASASNVMLTNTLPPGVGYKTNSLAFTRQGSGSNVVFNLGTLASNAFRNFILTVQPTNAGTLTFASVVTTSVIDPNTNNNTASHQHHRHQLFCRPIDGGHQFHAGLQSAKWVDGTIHSVSNTGTNAVAAARVVVTGLTQSIV